MDIYEDVVNRATIPVLADEAAMFEYHADRLATATVTQTFDYMIQAGLTYSYLTTGEAIIFLKLNWADMTLSTTTSPSLVPRLLSIGITAAVALPSARCWHSPS